MSNKYEIKIEVDEFAVNPREEYDHAATMLLYHRRYNLGDKQPSGLNDPPTVKDIEEYYGPLAMILPVWGYEHGGLAISAGDRTGQFCDRWDSGQLGYVFVTRETARKEWGFKRMTKRNKEKLYKYIMGEVEEYAAYVSGEVYGYIITDTETGEEVDSCWGFYGYDYCEQQAQEIVDYLAKKYQENARTETGAAWQQAMTLQVATA